MLQYLLDLLDQNEQNLPVRVVFSVNQPADDYVLSAADGVGVVISYPGGAGIAMAYTWASIVAITPRA